MSKKNSKALKRGTASHMTYAEKLRMKTDEERELRAHYNQQMMADALALAVHEVYGFGGKRITRLLAVLIAKFNEITHLVCEDAQNDEHFVYAKDTLDRALQQAYGKDYKIKPFEERYIPEGWVRVDEKKP